MFRLTLHNNPHRIDRNSQLRKENRQRIRNNLDITIGTHQNGLAIIAEIAVPRLLKIAPDKHNRLSFYRCHYIRLY